VLLQKDASVEKLAEEIELLNKNREMHKKALSQIKMPDSKNFAELL
jgi:hypothetical protein